MTSAARRAKLEYLSGVKSLGEAARLEQSEQATALQQCGPGRPLAPVFGFGLGVVGFAALLGHARAPGFLEPVLARARACAASGIGG